MGEGVQRATRPDSWSICSCSMGVGVGCDVREGGEANLGRALCHAKELGFVLKTSGNYGRVVSKGMRFLF